jgi:gluconate 2-dehydrogenase alpha chain
MTRGRQGPMDDEHGMSSLAPTPLSPEEVEILSTLMDGMFPADDLGPGALEIGVVDYLLKAFAGPYAHLITVYRDSLAGLDAAAHRAHGRRFAEVTIEQRDAIIDRLSRGELEEVRDRKFFDLAWQHLREGLFGDPIHGGNRQMLGWRLIGFPGAQFGYTAEEQQLDAVIARELRSVADLGAPGGVDTR